MQCDELMRALNDYVDGRIGSAVCRTLAKHLADCPACRLMVDNIRQTIVLYRRFEPVAMPEGSHERVRTVMRARWTGPFDRGPKEPVACDALCSNPGERS